MCYEAGFFFVLVSQKGYKYFYTYFIIVIWVCNMRINHQHFIDRIILVLLLKPIEVIDNRAYLSQIMLQKKTLQQQQQSGMQ